MYVIINPIVSVLPLDEETLGWLLGIIFGSEGGAGHLLIVLFAVSCLFRLSPFNLQKFFGSWVSVLLLSKGNLG
jgi:hypothetical protein